MEFGTRGCRVVLNSRQRRAEYVNLFAAIDTERIEIITKFVSGDLTDNDVERINDLNEMSELIVEAIEENGVFDG